jgi:hypothetical protein
MGKSNRHVTENFHMEGQMNECIQTKFKYDLIKIKVLKIGTIAFHRMTGYLFINFIAVMVQWLDPVK